MDRRIFLGTTALGLMSTALSALADDKKKRKPKDGHPRDGGPGSGTGGTGSTGGGVKSRADRHRRRHGRRVSRQVPSVVGRWPRRHLDRAHADLHIPHHEQPGPHRPAYPASQACSDDKLRNLYGITTVFGDVVTIDPDAVKARLADGATLQADRIVLAPGIDFDPVPGLGTSDRRPHAWKTGPQTALLANQLAAWLTAVFQYDAATASMTTVPAASGASVGWNTENFREMNKWFTALMADSFA